MYLLGDMQVDGVGLSVYAESRTTAERRRSSELGRRNSAFPTCQPMLTSGLDEDDVHELKDLLGRESVKTKLRRLAVRTNPLRDPNLLKRHRVAGLRFRPSILFAPQPLSLPAALSEIDASKYTIPSHSPFPKLMRSRHISSPSFDLTPTLLSATARRSLHLSLKQILR